MRRRGFACSRPERTFELVGKADGGERAAGALGGRPERWRQRWARCKRPCRRHGLQGARDQVVRNLDANSLPNLRVESRENLILGSGSATTFLPHWSPALRQGESGPTGYRPRHRPHRNGACPQGKENQQTACRLRAVHGAAMEPCLEGRENFMELVRHGARCVVPQWSPGLRELGRVERAGALG
jgi:hypothetical protein